jgi:FMN phosphatase YigB (HAD superfamily)
VRVAVDIDSTLHHYWDTLAAVVKRRFGVELSYEDQVVWDLDLRPEQIRAAVEETHRPEHVLAAEPYPGAVETVNGWHAAGHFILVASHRSGAAYEATQQWLDRIGLGYDELHCTEDKVGDAVASEIGLLIDDNPADLLRAVEAGMTAATLMHPWNREICEEEDIVCAPDWPGLRARLQPLLDGPA